MSDAFTWGSHVPINKALIDTFSPTGVIELGIGYNSTPAFREEVEYVLSVENDKAWLEKMQIDWPGDSKKTYLHHKVDEFRYTRRHDISEEKLKAANEFYNSLCRQPYNYLFIDCFSGYRLEAFNSMHEWFDFVVFHDYQPKRARGNHWGGAQVPFNQEKFSLLIDETYEVWTGIIYNKKFEDSICNVWEHHTKRVKEHSGNKFEPKLVYYGNKPH